jgi:hypothetical protein
MSKGFRIVLVVLLTFLTISILHVGLNIGFDKLGLTSQKVDSSFQVGFLPVT